MSIAKKGVVYCVTGNMAYLEAAFISAIALRNLEPDLPITLISEHPELPRRSLSHYGIEIRSLTPDELPQQHLPFLSRYIKTRLIHFSPYEETLLIDADILPHQPVRQLWQALDRGDLAMVKDRLPTVALCDHVSAEEKTYTLGLVAPTTTQYNSGVMLWRKNEQTLAMFDDWHREWQRFYKQDQLALVRSLHHHAMAVVELPRSYNISPIDSAPLLAAGQRIHLMHCWGGMVASGEFREIALGHCPRAVETAQQLLATTQLV
jgi:lipopolysaccharide biosynthesis glycosyltransferase